MTADVVPGSCRVVVLSDTHLRGSGLGRAGPPQRAQGLPVRGLPASACAHLEAADVILHAGDILHQEILDELARMAPTWAVLGNNDRDLAGVLPHTRTVDIAGVRIGMIHDSGARAGRPGRMRRRFPDAAVVVFGHSHSPCNEEGVDGQLLFNPGSPTQRRAAPHRTLGVLELSAGSVIAHRIVDLD